MSAPSSVGSKKSAKTTMLEAMTAEQQSTPEAQNQEHRAAGEDAT